MNTHIPNPLAAFTALFKFDLKVQWRNRRAVVIILLVPVLILLSWKGMVGKLGYAFVLSTCITIGLTAVGLMGYSNTLAKDRDRGIFQRLRAAPIPKSIVLLSRLSVQLVLIIVLTIIVFLMADQQLNIQLTPRTYATAFSAAIAGGFMYLGLGQTVAALIKNGETVNATTRLIYFLFIVIGMSADTGLLGEKLKTIVHWSPYGVVKTMIASALQPQNWSTDASISVMMTLVYGLIFCVAGTTLFKWNIK